MAGRQRVHPTDARAVLQRLHDYVGSQFQGSWGDFERQTRTPHATADRWQRRVAVPDLPALIRLGKRDALFDLNYIVLGRRSTGWVRAEELHGLLLNLDAATVQSEKLLRQMKRVPTKRRRASARKRSPQHRRKG
jgi:hypothetical protein